MPIQPGTTKQLWYWQLGTTRILWEKRIRIYKIKRNMISVKSDEKKEIAKIVLRGQLFFLGTLLWSSWSINASLRIKNEPHTFLPVISVRSSSLHSPPLRAESELSPSTPSGFRVDSESSPSPVQGDTKGTQSPSWVWTETILPLSELHSDWAWTTSRVRV